MNVCNSFGPAICYKYPSFTGFGPPNPNCMMDTEPGRCRRTDGRKWRCRQNVVPYQKYCEQHMHRGSRQRPSSRKHVEPSGNLSKPDHETQSPANPSDTKSWISVSSQTDLNPSLSRVERSNGVPAIVRRRSGKNRDPFSAFQTTLDARGQDGNKFDENNPVDIEGNCAMNRGNCIEVTYSGLQTAYLKKESSQKNDVPKGSYLGFVSPVVGIGVGCSPSTVLHCGAVDLSLGIGGDPNGFQIERRRCRRTDGKKWQCSREAVPQQKYCEAHMHRGVKRPVSNLESRDMAADASTCKARTTHTTPEVHTRLINLNIQPSSPQYIGSSNSASSTSDATTITDEIIGAYLAQSIPKI